MSLKVLREQVIDHGFGIYRFGDRERTELDTARHGVNDLARQLQLTRQDSGVVVDRESLSILQDRSESPLGRFPPYSNKVLNWHTDGYYNHVDEPVRTFLLHCIYPASQGGELTLLDPELVLIKLHENDSDVVSTLATTDAITIPGNVDREGHSRPDREVPVFYAHDNGSLGMRFTTRLSNIRFKTPEVAEAMTRVSAAIEDCSSWYAQIRLRTGEGLVARNVLHTRSAFSDSPDQPPRMMLRGRFLDNLESDT